VIRLTLLYRDVSPRPDQVRPDLEGLAVAAQARRARDQSLDGVGPVEPTRGEAPRNDRRFRPFRACEAHRQPKVFRRHCLAGSRASGILVAWNAIRSQPTWRFKANQPKDPDRPKGVYFTDIEPTEGNLRTLHKRLRIPKVKREYVFWFIGIEGLTQLDCGRGRDKRIFFSAVDYEVPEPRQKYAGPTEPLSEEFQ
jgi:hypothetical protein